MPISIHKKVNIITNFGCTGLTIIILITMMLLSQQIIPVEVISTPTPFPTSAAPTEAPELIYPPNGAVIKSNLPEFQYGSVSRATVYYIHIFNDEGFDLLLIRAMTYALPSRGHEYGEMTELEPLPDGHYFWNVQAERAGSGLGSVSETWSFTVETKASE